MKFMKSLFSLMSPKQKRSYFYLQILFLITASFQVAGIASLAPFITLLSRPELIHSNKFVHSIYVAIGSNNIVSFFTTFAIAIILFILISNLLSGFATLMRVKFCVKIGAHLQNEIYQNYIHNDYVFFSKNNSSILVSIIQQDTPRFVNMILMPFLNLTSQLFMAGIIVIGLFYVDYLIAIISVVIVGSIYFLIFKLLREKLSKQGAQIARVNKERQKLLNESLGGIKEVKLLGTEPWYIKQISHRNDLVLKSASFIALTGELPRYFVETVIFTAILILALYLLKEYGTSGKVISILSLYATAGYKLLPATQTIFRAVSSLKGNSDVVGLLKKSIETSTPATQNKFVAPNTLSISDPLIQLKNVFYRYPDAGSNALNDVSITINPRTIVAFVGASGAGKSTAVDIILGMLYPDTGQLVIDGKSITKENVRDWHRHIGYVPQNIFLVDDTISNNIAFGIPKDQINMERVIKTAKMANIHQYIENLPNKYETIVGERGAQLSGGQKQRIGIARALYHDTDVLILDEATSALDSITESQIMSEIHGLASARTIIIIAHRLSTVRNADNIVFFENGTVTDQGTFEELRTRNTNFDSLVKHSLEKSH